MMSDQDIKILIVDDDPAAQRLLRDILKGRNYTLLFANSGVEALQKAIEVVPDLVISDVMMPQMNGYDVCRALRADPVLSEVPIVLLTALNDRESRLRGIQAGADDFISKPYDAEELRARVRGITRLNRYRTMLVERERFHSQKKHDEARIREQAELLNQTSDAIIVHDANHLIIFWNTGAERMYGWKSDEVMRQNILDVLFSKALDQVLEARQRLSETGSWEGEFRQRNKYGKELIVESRWSQVYDGSGKPASTLIINTNITERRKIESQLLRTQRMETIGMLVGGVAHDLNNMLTPIQLGIQLLRMNVDEKQRQRVLDMIENSALRGSSLVRQVLSFARGGGKSHSTIQPKHLVKDLQMLVQETFPKNIAPVIPLPGDLWLVQGDITQLTQVLLNLCVNARDAMPNGGLLSVSAENVTLDESFSLPGNADARPGHYVSFTVSDTGIGIAPEIMEKIFDPFFTTKEAGKGTGIGLSTVRSIVQNHGGFIDVRSEPGCGSIFRVFLPAAEIDQKNIEIFDTPLPAGNGELILVVDDEASLVDITRGILEIYGYRVLTANNGMKAVELFRAHADEIALSLIDVQMPLIDGLSVARTLRDMRPSANIISASGLSSSEHRAKAAALGVKTFLAKPFSTRDLLEAIRAVLSGDEPFFNGPVTGSMSLS
jgi:two-component system, cell cycle sensor histidine kinase and response regulator CckA